MKTTRILSAALIVFAATACNTDYISETQTGHDLEPMTIAGAKTKTVFTPVGEGGTVSWTAGDQLAIYDNFGKRNIFNNSSEAVASFSGEVTAGTTEFWGVYPATRVLNFANGTATVSLPSDQTITAGTFAEELNISVTHGQKTPGVADVEGIAFHNVCGMVSFALPARINAKTVTFTANNRDIAGVLSVDCVNNTAAITSDGSRSVTMEGDFPAGSRFYFVVAPGTIEGFRIDVKTELESEYYKSASNGTLDVAAGKVANLPEIDFTNGAVSVSASHNYDGNTLTGSSLVVNHGIPENMWKDVTELSLSVSKGGTTYRTYKSSSVSEASVVPTGKVYLPQGTHTVSGYYTMNGVQTPIQTTVSLGAPKFAGTASVTGVTSYSKYQSGNVSGANSHNAETISNITASCTAVAGIAPAVLAELPVNYTIAIDGAAHKTGTTTSTAAVTASDKTGAAWGERTLTATFTFDGVSLNGSSKCHITGLPYRMAENNKSDRWTLSGGKVEFEDNSTILLTNSKQNSATLNLYAPSTINVSIIPSKIRLYTPIVNYRPSMTVNAGGVDLITLTADNGTNKDTDFNNQTFNGYITSGNSFVKFTRNYKSGTNGPARIYNLNVLYQ